VRLRCAFHTGQRFRVHVLFLVLVPTVAAAPAAWGAVATFDVAVQGENRQASAEIQNKAGVDYVSLTQVAERLGGSCRVRPTRVQVDLAGGTAWIGLNDTEVNASINQFRLRYPVLREGTDALIAVRDLGAFLENAFRATLEQTTLPDPPASAGTVASQDLDTPAETVLTNADASVSAGLRVSFDVIVVDPGHGGVDSGATGREYAEKELTLQFAKALAERLQTALGAAVILTRQDDIALSDEDRARVANTARENMHPADLFISLHAGASYSPAAHGFEVFYPTPGTDSGTGRPEGEGAAGGVRRRGYSLVSRDLAETVARTLSSASGAELRGVREVPARVLLSVRMPSLLIETGCLTNTAEESLLASDTYQTQVAEGIAAGLTEFLNAQGARP
jgi:N-acetylmuramoyl-L-alanine amidase